MLWGLDRSGSEPAPRTVRATLTPPESWYPKQARISPDGRTVAIVAEGPLAGQRGSAWKVFVRRLDRDDAFVPIETPIDREPIRFSPDSSQIAFVASEVAGLNGAALVRAPADGSAPPTLIRRWDESWRDDLVWLSDDEIAVVTMNPQRLVRVPVDGSALPAAVDLALADSGRFLVHSMLPDGSILGTVEGFRGGYHQDVARLDPATGAVEVLVDRGFEPAWLPPNRLIFSRRDQLLAAPFDPAARGAVGAPVVVATGLRTQVELTAALFSLSDRGDLVHLEGGLIGYDRRIVWLMPDGSREAWGDARGPFVEGELDDSQDGSVVAWVTLGTSGLFEVLASEVEDPAPRPALVGDGMDCDSPVVSPRGDFIAARCIGDETRDGIYLAPFPGDGKQGRRILTTSAGRGIYPRTWTHDGRALFVRIVEGDRSRILWLPIGEDGTPGEARAVEGLDGDIGSAMLAPDASLIAFTRWDGRAWVLHLAGWDGTRAGSSRPVMQVGSSGPYGW